MRAAVLYRASHEGQFLDTIALSFMFKPLREVAKEAAVLLYSPATDTFLEDMTRKADRVFYFSEEPRASPRLVSKTFRKRRRARPPWRLGHWSDGSGERLDP